MKPTHKDNQAVVENDFLDALVGTGVSMGILMGVFVLITAVSLLV